MGNTVIDCLHPVRSKQIEADKVVVFHIEHSNFPNWDGTEQRRAFSVKGDQLTYTSPGSTGVAAQVTMRRAK